MARNGAIFKSDFLNERLENISVDNSGEYSSLRQQIIKNYTKIISLQESGVSRKTIYAAIMDGIADETRISEATFYAYLVAAKKEYQAQQKAREREETKAKKAAGTPTKKKAEPVSAGEKERITVSGKEPEMPVPESNNILDKKKPNQGVVDYDPTSKI